MSTTTTDEPAAPIHDTTDHHPPQSSTSTQSDILKDIYLWRRWKLSATVVLLTTATWIVMEVYKFNFITAASWLAILLVSSLFIWGNLHRLFRKEEPDTSRLGVSEETAIGVANSIREWGEVGARWMFKIGAEKEWFVFAATVAALWLLSIVGSCFDLLTLLYFGNLMAMIVPVVHEKYDYKIKECRDRLKVQAKRFYKMFDERVIQKLRNTTGGLKKEMKVE